MKNKITFDKFLEIEKDLEVKFGTIVSVERVPKSKKLLKLAVDFGEVETVQVVTNIGGNIEDEGCLAHRQFYFITNLEPTTIMGIESHAMIIVPNKDGKLQLLPELTNIENGSTLL